MRRIKLIATWAMAMLAFACSTSPAYADEVHPWCGVVTGTVAMAIAAPEEAGAMLRAIEAHETSTDTQKYEASMAVLLGLFVVENEKELSDAKISEILDKVYNACLKEHA
jgi:hypothetical protein